MSVVLGWIPGTATLTRICVILCPCMCVHVHVYMRVHVCSGQRTVTIVPRAPSSFNFDMRSHCQGTHQVSRLADQRVQVSFCLHHLSSGVTPDWHPTHRHPQASAAQVIELKACTMAPAWLFFIKIYLFVL